MFLNMFYLACLLKAKWFHFCPEVKVSLQLQYYSWENVLYEYYFDLGSEEAKHNMEL